MEVTRLKKLSILTQIGCFLTVTPVWIHQWLWNDAQNFKYHRRGALLFFNIICQISRSHRTQIVNFDQNWVFPDCKSSSSLNSLMDLKWCTKLDVVKKRCPIVFQGHTSSCKVTRLKKSSILTQIRTFWTVTPIWIHQWLRNDAQSLKWQRRGALLVFKVIHQVGGWHGYKICRFWPKLDISRL